MLILISDAFDPSLPERLKTFGEVTDDKSRLAEAEVLLIRSKTKCTREYLDQAKALKLIIRGGVGMDNIDRAYGEEKGIHSINTPEASSVAVAEQAMTLMLGAINHLVAGHNGLAEGKWLKKQLKRSELYKKTLALIGIGRIGREVALRAKAFGMNVIAYDPFVDKSDVAELCTLEQLAEKADVISLHTPLTETTKNLIDGALIGKMKKGVVIVNTARGGVIDEAAMVAALEAEQVACYATDVWLSDPPADDCALLKAPRVLMAPHLGASSKENLLRIGDTVVELIEKHVASKK